MEFGLFCTFFKDFFFSIPRGFGTSHFFLGVYTQLTLEVENQMTFICGVIRIQGSGAQRFFRHQPRPGPLRCTQYGRRGPRGYPVSLHSVFLLLSQPLSNGPQDGKLRQELIKYPSSSKQSILTTQSGWTVNCSSLSLLLGDGGKRLSQFPLGVPLSYSLQPPLGKDGGFLELASTKGTSQPYRQPVLLSSEPHKAAESWAGS